MLKLTTTVLNHCKSGDEDYYALARVVHELDTSYREWTAVAGIMEPSEEGRPLLSVQDLESRLVFTRCKVNKPLPSHPNTDSFVALCSKCARETMDIWRGLEQGRRAIRATVLGPPIQRHDCLRQSQSRPSALRDGGASLTSVSFPSIVQHKEASNRVPVTTKWRSKWYRQSSKRNVWSRFKPNA